MGYKIRNNIIFQDNKSSITLEKYGRASGSKRTKHIKVRYFFIKDMIEQGEVEVQHCPTHEMWSDVLTNPKQGKEFLLMRSKLMGCEDTVDERSDTSKAGENISVTRDRAILRSPRGCVGGNIHTVRKNIHTIRKLRRRTGRLHVEGVRESSRRRMLEPNQRFMLATWGEERDRP